MRCCIPLGYGRIGTWPNGLPASSSWRRSCYRSLAGSGSANCTTAIVLLIAMGIGALSPSGGGPAFTSPAPSWAPYIETAARARLPYLMVLIIALLIVAFVPWFTVFPAARAQPRRMSPIRDHSQEFFPELIRHGGDHPFEIRGRKLRQ